MQPGCQYYNTKILLVFIPSSLLESLDELRLICQTAAVYCVLGSVLILTHIGSPVWTSPTTSAIFPVHALEEQSLGSLKHSNDVCLLFLKDKNIYVYNMMWHPISKYDTIIKAFSPCIYHINYDFCLVAVIWI